MFIEGAGAERSQEIKPGISRERGEPIEAQREATKAELLTLDRQEYLTIPDPDEPVQSIRVRLRSNNLVFQEKRTQTQIILNKKPREFTMDAMVDWVLKHRAEVRREYIYDSPKSPSDFAARAKEREAPKPVESPDAQKKINQLKALIVGEIVVAYDPEEKKLVHYVKIDNEPVLFSQKEEKGNNVRRDARLSPFYSEADIVALIEAAPALAEIIQNPEVRQKEAKIQALLAEFDNISATTSIFVDGRIYERALNGLYRLRSSAPQSRKGGTNRLREGYVTREEVRLILQRAQDIESISFLDGSNERVGQFAESNADLKSIHERFNSLIPELYPSTDPGHFAGEWNIQKILQQKSPENRRDKTLNHLQESSHIEQGKIGLCYGLGAAHAIKTTSPEVYFDMLARTIKKEGDTWKVRFMGVDTLAPDEKKRFEQVYPDGWIPVTKADIKEWKEGVTLDAGIKRASKADLPDIILERAYLSYQSFLEKGEIGQTFIANAEGDLAAEGGFGHRAIYDFMGPLVEKWKIADYQSQQAYESLQNNGNAEEARNFFESEYAKNPSRYFVTVNTPAYPRGAAGAEKYITFTDPDGVERKLSKKHAYAVVGYRALKSGETQIRIANPHNTKTNVFWMNMKDFTSIYSQVSYAKLQADFRRTDPEAKKIIESAYAKAA